MGCDRSYKLSPAEVDAVERLDAVRRDVRSAAACLLEVGSLGDKRLDIDLRNAAQRLTAIADEVDGLSGAVYGIARGRVRTS